MKYFKDSASTVLAIHRVKTLCKRRTALRVRSDEHQLDLGVGVQTRKRYNKILSHFCASSSLPFGRKKARALFSNTPGMYDLAACEFINHLYHAFSKSNSKSRGGERESYERDLPKILSGSPSATAAVGLGVHHIYGVGVAGDLMSALKDRFPFLRRHLGEASRGLGILHRLEPPVRVLPLPSSAMYAMVGLLISFSLWNLALAVVIGFCGYIRPGEIYKLRRRDFSLSGKLCTVALRDTKTGKSKGIADCAILDQPKLVALVTLCLSRCGSDEQLVLTPDFFRANFQWALTQLGLASYGFEVRSLRRGGATHDFQHHGSYHLCAERGRWESIDTCRIYIQDAVASLVAVNFDKSTCSKIGKHSAFLGKLVAR